MCNTLWLSHFENFNVEQWIHFGNAKAFFVIFLSFFAMNQDQLIQRNSILNIQDFQKINSQSEKSCWESFKHFPLTLNTSTSYGWMLHFL